MGELDVSQIISVAEAIEIIDSVALEPCVEQIPLHRAQGYSLAEEVRADRDYPPFDKSLMDGFALRGPEREAKIIGEIAAGNRSEIPLQPGEAVAIMTGAPIPAGTYAVVPVEHAEVAGDQLRIREAFAAGQNISRRGADVAAGAVVLNKAQILEAAQLAVAASVGKTLVSVYSRPRVGVLSTGDEIVPVELSPVEGQIRDSNSIMLVSQLRRMSCCALDLGHVRDERELIAHRISQALATVDVLFITGGMSMGKYDYTPGVLKELGVELLITKVRIKPGKPFVFGRKKRTGGDAFVFGLPGNPVSAMICALRLANRLLRRMQGQNPEGRWFEGKLLADVPANGSREFYQPVRWEEEGVRPLAWKGSADVFTLAQADGLLVRMENAPIMKAGERVRVMVMA